MTTLTLVVGWLLVGFLAALEVFVLWWLWKHPDSLRGIISEGDPSSKGGTGKASLSRFQFLVFTFVIAMSFVLIVVGGPTLRFPDVPNGVFALLGVSGASYVVSKGIQKGGAKDDRSSTSTEKPG